MLITLETHHDWVYALQRRIVPGHNYISETMLKLCWGKPGGGEFGFDGYRLMSMYSVRYDGTLLTSSAHRGCSFDIGKCAIDACVDHLLKKLDGGEYAAPDEFYSRSSFVGCAGIPLLTHELLDVWDIQPVLDERLWKRYVDSINRAAADAVVC